MDCDEAERENFLFVLAAVEHGDHFEHVDFGIVLGSDCVDSIEDQVHFFVLFELGERDIGEQRGGDDGEEEIVDD